MAFPTDLTNAVNRVTKIIAEHLNALEAKIGIDGSAVATTLDYLVKNILSVDPGHKHSKLWASDGSPEAVTVGATGSVTLNSGIFTVNSNLINFGRLLPYANNTAALAAGLHSGDLYRTATGVVMVTYTP